jgi:hypothetical protein
MTSSQSICPTTSERRGSGRRLIIVEPRTAAPTSTIPHTVTNYVDTTSNDSSSSASSTTTATTATTTTAISTVGNGSSGPSTSDGRREPPQGALMGPNGVRLPFIGIKGVPCPYRQLPINVSSSDRFMVTWNRKIGHHFFLWEKIA